MTDPSDRFFRSADGGHYHYNPSMHVAWSVAESYCKSLGAELASIETIRELGSLSSLLKYGKINMFSA